MSIFVNAYSTIRQEVPFHGSGSSGEAIALRTLADLDADKPFPVRPDADPHLISEAAELKNHLNGFYNYAVEQGVERAGEYTTVTHAVGQHIRHVCCNYAFERPDGFSPEDLREFAPWAAQTNSIFFFPDGTVRNADGVDLLDPALADRTPPVLPPVTAESFNRMQRIRGELWNNGIRISPLLPPVRSEKEILLRTPEEMFTRATTLAVVGTVAGFVLEDRPVDFVELRGGSRFAFDSFTETEQEFIARIESVQDAAGAPRYTEADKQAAFQLHWGFIAAELLAWAVGLVEIDTAQLYPADLSMLRGALRAAGRQDNVADALRLRDLSEICDLFERTFSLRWYAVEQDVSGAPSADGANGADGANQAVHIEPVESSILLERHRAFAWMTVQDVPFDQVDLST